MSRPPPGVVLVARTHGIVGGVILASTLLLYAFTRQLPRIEFGLRTYVLCGALAGLYLLAGVLVWRGATLGRTLSRICTLLYLPRPRFGAQIWRAMATPDFQAHFERTKPPPPPFSGRADDPGIRN
jgi:hypothetical protein